jgi:hypothetical protein
MSAVLAKKQAEPLMTALVKEATALRDEVIKKSDEVIKKYMATERFELGQQLPPAVARLVQCLAEEAEASSEILTTALQIIAFFARGAYSNDNWQALLRGPYGEELLHQTWMLFSSVQTPSECWLIHTLSTFTNLRHTHEYLETSDGQNELLMLLNSADPEDRARSFFIARQLISRDRLYDNNVNNGSSMFQLAEEFAKACERDVFDNNVAVRRSAIFAWADYNERTRREANKVLPKPKSGLLDCILLYWLDQCAKESDCVESYALVTQIGLSRNAWAPVLTTAQKRLVRKKAGNTKFMYDRVAALIIAFHARGVWSEEQLAKRLIGQNGRRMAEVASEDIRAMLSQMGTVGMKYIHEGEVQDKSAGGPGLRGSSLLLYHQ